MNRKVSELEKNDKDWIEQNAARGDTLCQFYGFTQGQLYTFQILDQVFKSWKEDIRSNKPTGSEIISGLGCLFGRLTREEFGLEWKIVTDNFGTDLAFHAESAWETYPFHFVAKRVQLDCEGI